MKRFSPAFATPQAGRTGHSAARAALALAALVAAWMLTGCNRYHDPSGQVEALRSGPVPGTRASNETLAPSGKGLTGTQTFNGLPGDNGVPTENLAPPGKTAPPGFVPPNLPRRPKLPLPPFMFGGKPPVGNPPFMLGPPTKFFHPPAPPPELPPQPPFDGGYEQPPEPIYAEGGGGGGFEAPAFEEQPVFEEVMPMSGRGFGSGPSCFPAGTLVWTPEGPLPIERVTVGTFVVAPSPALAPRLVSASSAPVTAAIAAPSMPRGAVIRVTRLNSHHLRHLEFRTLRGEACQVDTTDGHQFWVEDRGWTDAANLVAGQLFRSGTGEYATLERTYREDRVPGVFVYNLEVEGSHAYRVGATGLIVKSW